MALNYRATAQDGTTYDYDAEVSAHPTHLGDSPVVSRELVPEAEPDAEAPQVPSWGGGL